MPVHVTTHFSSYNSEKPLVLCASREKRQIKGTRAIVTQITQLIKLIIACLRSIAQAESVSALAAFCSGRINRISRCKKPWESEALSLNWARISGRPANNKGRALGIWRGCALTTHAHANRCVLLSLSPSLSISPHACGQRGVKFTASGPLA